LEADERRNAVFLCWRKVSFLIDGAGSKAALRRAQVLRLIATLPPGRPAPQSDMVRYHVTRAPRRLCGQIRGVVVKIFLLGATGNSGRRILRLALQRAHEVTAFVRDETKLQSLVDRPIPPNLHVSIGDISNSADIARVMVGHDVAINAAGTVTEGSTFTRLVQTVVDSTIISLGEGGRLANSTERSRTGSKFLVKGVGAILPPTRCPLFTRKRTFAVH